MIIKATFGGLVQLLATADLHDRGTLDLLDDLLDRSPSSPSIVYSDPPWNPGNEKYWRRHAGASETPGYDSFLDAWCTAVRRCIDRGAMDVFCEQSANPKHRQMMVDAVERARWPLPLLEEWTVYYGSPGSRSVQRPNTLLHFGDTLITTDPSNMAGEPMTIRVCAGLAARRGSTIVDVCMGKGMTSRMAHYFGWNCVGLELNPARLEKTVQWLKRQGYEIEQL